MQHSRQVPLRLRAGPVHRVAAEGLLVTVQTELLLCDFGLWLSGPTAMHDTSCSLIRCRHGFNHGDADVTAETAVRDKRFAGLQARL